MANTSVNSGMRRKRPMHATEHELALIEVVRSRAYELYESRGKENGHDLDGWLLAEQEVVHLAGKRKQILASPCLYR